MDSVLSVTARQERVLGTEISINGTSHEKIGATGGSGLRSLGGRLELVNGDRGVSKCTDQRRLSAVDQKSLSEDTGAARRVLRRLDGPALGVSYSSG